MDTEASTVVEGDKVNRGTCKFYNGDFHNTHCEAGVCYRDVTTEPDRIEGSAYRKPCIDWDLWNRAKGRAGFDNEIQAQEWAKRGHCDKREEPTDTEIDAWEAEVEARTNEVLASLKKGIVPPGVMVCGPGTFGKCKCNCPDGPCEHVWDGPEARDEDPDAEEIEGENYVPSPVVTATCSRCGKWQINHDMWL